MTPGQIMIANRDLWLCTKDVTKPMHVKLGTIMIFLCVKTISIKGMISAEFIHILTDSGSVCFMPARLFDFEMCASEFGLVKS